MYEINGIQVPFLPINNFEGNRVQNRGSSESFESIFQQELEKIKFSHHAVKRLEERQIKLSDEDIAKINSAVEKAEQKGSRDSLVMMNSTAFIVNIPNRTIITAMPIDRSGENVFTNIDSVVFA
ncbi:MAG: flagellar protein [Ignavibacterium sp.]|nr:flagellar protein [Ignavibacterium sp.]MCX7610624.1 flagellar protein [Ignavibacterium sp.]MDW8374128.1 TIGR02530 family flagellar biosynthesis protein [Ignavibacteriales bacterium]